MDARWHRLIHGASLLLVPAAAAACVVAPRRATETAAAVVVAVSAVSDCIALARACRFPPGTPPSDGPESMAT